VNTEANFEK
jgi:hypothetical protein